MIRLLLAALALLVAAPAAAQDFPKLTGRVVDQADLLSPADEAELTRKLEAVQQASSRQLVVATIPDLQGYPIEDYGYRLGRHWGIGQKEADNGILLIVAPNDRRVRIEVGYGLEPIMTDALSSVIIEERILPRFKADDYPGGIKAGADAIIEQLQAPPEVAEQKALAAQQAESEGPAGDAMGFGLLLFWGAIFFFVILPMMVRRRRGPWGGRRYRGSALPIVLWTVANEMGRASRKGGGWGGGSWGGGGGGGFGGFSGGGGSFGGGGASGGW